MTGNTIRTAPPVTPSRTVPSTQPHHSQQGGRKAVPAPGGPSRHFEHRRPGPPGRRWLRSARSWDTPGRLRILAAAVAVVAVAAGITSASFAAATRGRVSSVVHTDAPSVQATSDFLLKVADMDAQLANILLVHDDTTLSIRRADTMRLYEADRSAADADLTRAAAVLAGDPAAERTLRTVSDLFGEYQEKAVRTMQLDEQAHLATAGNAPDSLVGGYLNTLSVLEGPGGTGSTPAADPHDQDSLMFQARLLDQQSSDAIRHAADSTQSTLRAAQTAVTLLGLALLALLGRLQALVWRRFHRVLSPGFAAATVVALVLVVGGLVALGETKSRLHNATDNAFGSIRALTDAKALAYDANADESRWLLEGGGSDRFELSFLTKSQAIADVAESASAGGVDVAPRLVDYENRLALAGSTDGGMALVSPESAFGQEFANITFPGEDEAARAALLAFIAYQADDATLRSLNLALPADVHRGIDFDTDAHDAQSSDARFNAFSASLDKVIAINQEAFDSSSASALSGLEPLTWLPYLEALAVIALLAAGLRPRLGEFR